MRRGDLSEQDPRANRENLPIEKIPLSPWVQGRIGEIG